MPKISVTYTVEWELKFAKNYQWTKCGKCFNSKTGKLLSQCYKNGMIGYYIESKFYSLKKLRSQLQKIKEIQTPF